MAEGMGTYALFLGSGTSRESGIPTGTDILNDAIELLYKDEKDVKKVNDEELKQWYKNSSFKEYTYSKILEGLCPLQEDRRKFLEKYFVGKKPTESHYLIAEMVKNGIVKVIITTNFDRLIEDALSNENIQYDLISSENDLKTSPPREHSNCWLLKLHGDYKRLNIKNTKKELEKLEPLMENQFQEVLNNYGTIVMGYSGSDESVMSCFEKRDSNYMLYWLTREEPNQRVKELILEQKGKQIQRKSAEIFLKELCGKIKTFQIHKTGETPEFVTRQIKNYIKENDQVSFQETIKNQIKNLENEWKNIYESTNSELKSGNVNAIKESFEIFETYMDSITTIGLVLIEYPHNFISYFFKQLQNIYDLSEIILEENPNNSYRRDILEIPRAAIFNLYYTLGAFCLKEENFAALGTLLQTELTANKGPIMKPEPIWSLGEIFYPQTFDENTAIIFNILIESYENKGYLKDFFRSKKEFITYHCQFNLILCLYIASKLKQFPDNDYDCGFYPHFARFRSLNKKIMIPLFKIKSNQIFLEEITKAFNEKPTTFTAQYKRRCEMINKEIENISGRYRKIPCDIFYGTEL